MMRTLTFAAALAAVIARPAIAEDAKIPATATEGAGTLLTAQSLLTDQEAKAWVGKPVYSSDGKNLGEVGAILRSADNKITELRADIGGFLGIGEHEIAIPASQFALHSDRVVLDLTSAAAKALPKVAK
jgi:opacity protein-like surface antigen